MNRRWFLGTALIGVVIVVSFLVGVMEAASSGLPPVHFEATRAAAATSWSSGWFAIDPGETLTFTHDLAGDVGDYGVELWFHDTDAGGLGVHTFGYGGFEEKGQWEGGYWSNLTTSSVTVHRMVDDTTADRMRLRIWFITSPNYDSDWQEITAGNPLTLTHALGGTAEDYTLNLWFEDQPGGYGIHNRYMGSVEHEDLYEGAHWQNLTAQTLRVIRWTDDVDVERVRVRIVETPPEPAYDSGWLAIETGETLTLTHNIGGQAGLYRVALDYRDTSSLTNTFGQNVLWAGGEAVGENRFGGHWQRLTNSSIEIYRQPGGLRAAKARLRIWTPKYTVFLPLITGNYVPAVELAHEDGEQDSWQSWEVGKGFATCFSPPAGSTRLIEARYYLQNAAPIEVHVWSSDTHTDLIAPFQAATVEGWNHVDLSGFDLMVNGDFCVGFLHTEAYLPDIGVDEDNQGYSYEVDGAYWELRSSAEYMIRAVIQ